MAVLESTPNALNTLTSTTPYGCKNREMRDGYFAPARRYFPDGSFEMTSKYIHHSMSKECRYDRSLTDVRCAGCEHRGSGEAYNAMVRTKGT